MKVNFLIAAAGLWLALCIPTLAQNTNDEITVRSRSGDCAAYISNDDDSTIYLWNGEPVAYLVSQDIYGFNGKHLGWFIKGLVYNHDGDVVGAVTSRFKTPQPICSIKSLKSLKPLKSLKELKPLRPLFHLTWSDDETLKRFLLTGKDGNQEVAFVAWCSRSERARSYRLGCLCSSRAQPIARDSQGISGFSECQ
jgi:hypothetical protein